MIVGPSSSGRSTFAVNLARECAAQVPNVSVLRVSEQRLANTPDRLLRNSIVVVDELDASGAVVDCCKTALALIMVAPANQEMADVRRDRTLQTRLLTAAEFQALGDGSVAPLEASQRTLAEAVRRRQRHEMNKHLTSFIPLEGLSLSEHGF